jgi:hypothetical protein
LGHTVFVLGGKAAAGEDVLRLTADLRSIAGGSPVIDAVIGLCTRRDGLPIGRMDESVAEQLGISGVTILAVRPDRFVGFRHDGTDSGAITGYLATFGS